MARQYNVPGVGYVNEKATKQYLIPGTVYVNETVVSSATPITSTPSDDANAL